MQSRFLAVEMGRRVIVGLIALFFWLGGDSSVRAFTTNDVNAAFGAYNSAFYSQSGTNGYFKDTQLGNVAYFWGQAEMIECVIDSYEWHSNAVSRAMVTNLLNGFISNNGSSWTWDGYNDDILWAVIAFARGGQDTGQSNYCKIAKANFDAVYARAWSTSLGGGLFWQYPYNASKNACVNGPGAIAASLLYQIYGDSGYWNKATNIYAWERSVLFNSTSGAIYDNIGTNGAISTWSSTYNQGTFIGAANFLGQTNDAARAANFTMMNLTTGGILPEYGIAGNNSGFNAIFWRWMVRFMRNHQLQAAYEPWLQQNAAAAWAIRRADNLSWCQWLHPSPAGTNFYSWDCISSFEVMQAANPTQGTAPAAVPTDAAGYWPLDAAGAADASGLGNNGVVNGTGWNAQGRFNGCFTFNGSGSYVQVTNNLDNDFSIAFWVKTTQTAGVGQWYNGAGLVDGDAPSLANDFGTALVGGKFAFGTGNPDTTILSTTTINDGAWHQCVATRQQATGLMSVYVDGNLEATRAANRNTLNASARLLFGAVASGNGWFNGSLDDVKFFNRTLSAGEVGALYTSVLSAPVNAPVNLVATAGNGQVRLSWDTAANATGYLIKRARSSAGPYVVITNIPTTVCVDSNVVNHQTYYYSVSATNICGAGPDSSPVGVNVSALKAWFRADAITNLASGSLLSLWPDMSGNGFNAVQTVGSNCPAFISGATNGGPVVRFSAAHQSYLWFFRPVEDDFTIILVYQSSLGIGTGSAFWTGAGLVNGEVGGTADDYGISLNANGQILAGTGNPDTSIASNTGLANGRPHVVTFRRTRSSGIILLYIDGTAVAVAAAGKQSLTSPNQLVLGAQQTLNNYFTGDLAEVQIYGASLSDNDRISIEQALKCKYNITGGGTPTAPVGLSLAAGNRQISATWTLLASPDTYSVYRSTDNGASYQVVASGLSAGSYLDTNAVCGQTNLYKVAATDDCGTGAYSAPMGILLPLPALAIRFTPGAFALSWPAWATDWTLYGASNLAPPVVWWPVTNGISSSNGWFSINLSAGSSAGAQFFRLASP